MVLAFEPLRWKIQSVTIWTWLLQSQYFYVVVRYIYHSVLNFDVENEFFCLQIRISDFIENVGYGWDWKDQNLSPSVLLWCSMFSIHVSAGFRGLIPHLDQVTLYLYQDSNEKTIPLNIIVSASKFSKLKRGSGICNCFGNFTIREKNPLLLTHHDVINFGSCYL